MAGRVLQASHRRRNRAARDNLGKAVPPSCFFSRAAGRFWFDAGCMLWATVRRRSFLVCAVCLGGLGGLVEGARLRGKYRLGGFFCLTLGRARLYTMRSEMVRRGRVWPKGAVE